MRLLFTACPLPNLFYSIINAKTMKHMKTMSTVLLVVLLAPTGSIAYKYPPNLDERVKAELATFKGKVNLFAKNFDTGETYALGADDRVRTASTIKIAVMVEAFARVAEGKAKWTDDLVLTKEKKVSGSGILGEMSDGLHLALRDGVNLMMLLSDNTATNLVLDVLTTDAVNARIESLGLKNIKILRKVGSGGDSIAGKDTASKRFGLGFATLFVKETATNELYPLALLRARVLQ